MKYFVCVLCVLLSLNLYAQELVLEPKLDNIKWIAGHWKGEAFGGQVEEIWSEPSGGSMMATFKLIDDGKVSFYEIEIIREIENSLVLQLKHFNSELKGWETKDETVDFPLKKVTATQVVFEGMRFEKVNDHEMTVFVDIHNDKGEVETVAFNYHKAAKSNKPLKKTIEVIEANQAPIIDGKANEKIWSQAEWHSIDQLWLGNAYNDEDFQGRYKLTWTTDALYLLAEITDDILVDNETDPLKSWWDDDCLEVFIDEDNSGGEHQFNHNAFAYHVDLAGNVVDMSPSEKGKLYNSHIESKRMTRDKVSIWELKISIFDDNYNEEDTYDPVELKANKAIGFALAYCDNDQSKHRENFIGSIRIEGDDKNRGWIDADIFGNLIFIKNE